MAVIDGINPSHSAYGATLWTAVRNFHGPTSIQLRDVTITSKNVNGGTNVHQFAYADYKISFYKRSGEFANNIVATKIIRKYWGQWTSWIGYGSLQSAGYSFHTELIGAYNSSGQKIGFAANPWVNATFSVSYG